MVRFPTPPIEVTPPEPTAANGRRLRVGDAVTTPWGLAGRIIRLVSGEPVVVVRICGTGVRLPAQHCHLGSGGESEATP